MTFSSTVIWVNGLSFWKVRATPSRLISIRPEPRDGAAVQQDLARIRRLEAREEVEERGLAGAVGADDPDELSRAHPEGNVVVGDEAAEALRDAAHVQHQGRAQSASEARGEGSVH